MMTIYGRSIWCTIRSKKQGRYCLAGLWDLLRHVWRCAALCSEHDLIYNTCWKSFRILIYEFYTWCATTVSFSRRNLLNGVR
jgi:hypothetical protein